MLSLLVTSSGESESYSGTKSPAQMLSITLREDCRDLCHKLSCQFLMVSSFLEARIVVFFLLCFATQSHALALGRARATRV